MSRRKKLGQIFLKNQKIVEEIIKTLNPQTDELIIEIGPGKGILTEPLIKSGAMIMAVEKDKSLCDFLKEKFSSSKNLSIINQDIRDFLKSRKFKEIIKNKDYKIVGNIPYYLTSYLLRLLMELKEKPKTIVVMVQKEVAQRIIAQPPKMNLLAVLIQFYFKPSLIKIVKKGNFLPIPKVDSAIIKLEPYYNEYNTNPFFERKFIKIVKTGFSHPRKTLGNNLKELNLNSKLKKIPFLNTRAENLQLKEWLYLTTLF